MNDEQIAQLIEAIRQQTAAITRLADSNVALVAAMADGDGVDEEPDSNSYLDGSPA